MRIILLAGLILSILTGFILTVFWFGERNGSRVARKQDNFFLLLNEYDASARVITGTDKEYEFLSHELDRLEKRAISVESWLSVLKRRRALAGLHYHYAEIYRNSINRALKAYPSLQQLTALSAAALLKDTAINSKSEQKLREMLNSLTEPSFDRLRLSLHILLGDFSNPQTAVSSIAGQIDRKIFSSGELSRSASAGNPDENEDLIVDLAILHILNGGFREAAYEIQTHLNSSNPVTDNFIRFAAEYYYDFADIRRSAELFSRLEDEKALIRQADALYLAGYTGTARSIWLILADSFNENSLYNLAVTADDQNQSVSFLEELVKADPLSEKNSRQFGLIRYSRLLDNSEAAALLEDLNKIPSAYPYIDLEICRRSGYWQEPGRQVAEAWLLLDRYPDIENLYWWAAWKIFYQRFYDEAKILFNHAERLEFTGQWVSVYKAILLMQEGNLEMAEKILSSLSSDTADWYINANLGRIYESQRYPIRALEQYELAALKAQNRKIASIMQFRIARCFFTLGRISEANKALQHALDLDPDNINAKFEYDRGLGFRE